MQLVVFCSLKKILLYLFSGEREELQREKNVDTSDWCWCNARSRRRKAVEDFPLLAPFHTLLQSFSWLSTLK